MIELLGNFARNGFVPDELSVAVKDGSAGRGDVKVEGKVEAGGCVGLAGEAQERTSRADAKKPARCLEIKNRLRIGRADKVLVVGLPKVKRSVKIAGKELGHGVLLRHTRCRSII